MRPIKRVLACLIALALCLSTPAFAVSPNIDAGTNAKFTISNWSVNTSFSSTANVFQTSGNNQLAIAVISYEGNNALHVNSFTVSISGTTLTFSLISGARVQSGAGQDYQAIEFWQCQVPSQFNSGAATTTTAMTTSGSLDDAFITVFSVQALGSIAAPFDPNGSLPVGATPTGNVVGPTLTYSTTNADDLLLFTGATSGNTSGGTPTGWTLVSSGINGGGAKFQGQRVSTKSVSSAQTSQTVADSSGVTTSSWAALMLAFTANGVTPPATSKFPFMVTTP